MLFPAAAFAVHQLRYELAYGSRLGRRAERAGPRVPRTRSRPGSWCCSRSALGSFLVRARAGRRGRAPRRDAAPLVRRRSGRSSSVALLAVYSRAGVARGRRSRPVIPAGLAGIFGHGGWWAVPLAVALRRSSSRCCSAPPRPSSRRSRGSRPAAAARCSISGFSAPGRRSVRPARRCSPATPAGRAPPGTSPAAVLAAASHVPTARKETQCGSRAGSAPSYRSCSPRSRCPHRPPPTGAHPTVALDYRLALSPATQTLPGCTSACSTATATSRCASIRGASLVVRGALQEPLLRIDSSRASGSTRARRRRPSDRLVSTDQARLDHAERRRIVVWHDHRLSPPPASRPGPAGTVLGAGRRRRRADARSRATFVRVARPGCLALGARGRRARRGRDRASRSGGASSGRR